MLGFNIWVKFFLLLGMANTKDTFQGRKSIQVVIPAHTASFRNIIIQWTSLDDLTEKKFAFAYFEKNCEIRVGRRLLKWFDRISLRKCLQNLQINLEGKRMDGSSWNLFFITLAFNLIFAGEVLFTVNGLL